MVAKYLKAEQFMGYNIQFISHGNKNYTAQIFKGKKLVHEISGEYWGKYQIRLDVHEYIGNIVVPLLIPDYMAKVRTPPGFHLENRWPGYFWEDKKPNEIILISDDIKIRISFDVNTIGYDSINVDGNIDFKSGDKWFTFDQRGIGDAFTEDSKDYPDPNILIKEQIKRARDEINKRSSQIRHDVPGLSRNFNISEERRLEMVKELKAGERARLTPGGMGVAYEFRTHPGPEFDKRANKSTAEFFEVDILWVSELDWD